MKALHHFVCRSVCKIHSVTGINKIMSLAKNGSFNCVYKESISSITSWLGFDLYSKILSWAIFSESCW